MRINPTTSGGGVSALEKRKEKKNLGELVETLPQAVDPSSRECRNAGLSSRIGNLEGGPLWPFVDNLLLCHLGILFFTFVLTAICCVSDLVASSF
jgi:hypothetical protein